MGKRKKKSNVQTSWWCNKMRLGSFVNNDHTYCLQMPILKRYQRLKRKVMVPDEEKMPILQKYQRIERIVNVPDKGRVIQVDNNSSIFVEDPELLDNSSQTPPPLDCTQHFSTVEEKYRSQLSKILKKKEDKNVLWQIHKCKLCSYRSKVIFVMFKHIGVHQRNPSIDTFLCDSNTPEMYECEFCEFKISFKVHLTEHIRVLHCGKKDNKEFKSMLKRFRCKRCDFQTHSVLVLGQHLGPCNTAFRNKSKLEHVHSDSKDCEQKDSIARNDSNLKHDDHDADLQDCIQKDSTVKNNSNLKDEDADVTDCVQKDSTVRNNSNLKNEEPDLTDYVQEEIIVGNNSNLTNEDADDSTDYAQEESIAGNNSNLKNEDADLTDYAQEEDDEDEDSNDSVQKDSVKVYMTRNRAKNKPKNIIWFECDKCSFKTKIQRNLRRHTLRLHTNLKNIRWFFCNYCPYETNVQDYLKVHIESMHGSKWRKCERCAYTTKNKTYLRQHARIHRNLDSLYDTKS